VHGHAGADVHVLVCIIDPHIPHVSLHAEADQSDQVPPGAHAVVAAEAVVEEHVNGPGGASVVFAGRGPQMIIPLTAIALYVPQHDALG
jgi:hypothetical protein